MTMQRIELPETSDRVTNGELTEAVLKHAYAHGFKPGYGLLLPIGDGTKLQGDWFAYVNVTAIPVDQAGITVRPYEIAVWYRGWFVGRMIPPNHWSFIDGPNINAGAFMAALKAAK